MTDEMAACIVTPPFRTTDAHGVIALTTPAGDLLALRYADGGIMLTARAYTPAELREIASWGERV